MRSASFEDRLDIDRDAHIVPHHDAAPVKNRVPAHAEVVPVDDSCGSESGARYRSLIHAVRPAGVDSKTRTDRADGTGKDLAKVREFVTAARLTR